MNGETRAANRSVDGPETLAAPHGDETGGALTDRQAATRLNAAFDAPADSPRGGLRYPCGEPPAPGTTKEVAPGVHWLRMALPFALDHINLWALEDDGGWTIVDTGVCNEETVASWRRLFPTSNEARRITRVIVTHLHPDHVGTAGWLTRKFGCRLWMTRLEYLQCRGLVADTGREAPADAIAFYRQAGWSESALETYRTRFGNFGKLIHPLPDAYRRLQDGEQLSIDGRKWCVVVGSGHSPEHACLYSAESNVLISGDQILPRISSNVSVYPMEPDADPMREWYGSLARLRLKIPADALVLPAHNECFIGLHTRIDQLERGQDASLNRLRQRLQEAPQRVVDVFGALFARRIDEGNDALLGMATGEGVACLNYLLHRGEATRAIDSAGVAWYRSGS